ncbi:occludin [Myiozetetes cayanensis]|uniref:occludin n=1 Tax=Myiozetetes cayanensis TaxID=478635 RepID=UPI00215E0D40|nr:occludin [Myiozetetes cayanensis]XP_050177129.1 occludin [Myiozetetes cayanensis]
MFSKKSYDSPPTGYGPPTNYGPPTGYGAPTGDYGYDYGARSPPPGSYYIEDVPQHFYKWSSPPGVVRILEATIILLCIAIFACVASTLAWEYGYGFGGLYGSGLGGFYGSGYYGSGLNYGYGYGGYYGGVTNPRTANGFMIAMAVLCFLAQLGLFVASVSKSSGSRSRRFYLVVLVVSAVLALAMLIASIVYVVGVNPQAQMTGSYYYNPLLTICSQIYSGSTYLNQYLYHYCTVDPQEAVAIVCGFLIVILLCLICFFAHKTRSKIWKYGKPNIYWDKVPVVQEGPNVEEWVKNVTDGASAQDETATLAYSEKPTSPITAPPYSPPSYSPPPNGYYPSGTYSTHGDPPEQEPSPAEGKGREQPPKPPTRRGRRRRRNPELDESQYETDYTTAVESGDERDRDQWASLYPPISSDATRQRYKQEFDSDLRRYKELCADMDAINDRLGQLGKQLDSVPEDSPQYQDLAEEYNRLKDLKRSPDYQSKKLETKTLRNKLFHIKRMVSDYDKVRG